jgi:MFS family permease
VSRERSAVAGEPRAGEAAHAGLRISKFLLIVSFFHLVNDAAVSALSMSFPTLYDQGFIITRYSHIGTLFLVGLVVSVLTQSLIGSYAREGHYRMLLPAAILGLGLSLALITRTSSFMSFLLVFLLIKIAASFYHPLGVAWVCDLHRGENLDHSMGFQSAMGNLGVFLAFAVGGVLTEKRGWEFPILLWAVVACAISIGGFLVSRQKDRKATALATPRWSETFGRVRPYLSALVLGGMAWSLVLGFAPSLFHHRMGVSVSHTGYILASWIGAGTISSMLYGRLVRHTGHRLMLALSYSGVLVCSLLLAIVTNPLAALAVMLLFGFFLFLTYPCLLSCVGRKLEGSTSPGAFSIVANLQIIGGAVFSFPAGFLSDAYGIESPFFLFTGLAAAVIFSVALRTNRD